MLCRQKMERINKKYLPIIKNSTLAKAKRLNQMNIALYKEFTSFNTMKFLRFDANAFQKVNKKNENIVLLNHKLKFCFD